MCQKSMKSLRVLKIWLGLFTVVSLCLAFLFSFLGLQLNTYGHSLEGLKSSNINQTSLKSGNNVRITGFGKNMKEEANKL